jgi:hypothetical protein
MPPLIRRSQCAVPNPPFPGTPDEDGGYSGQQLELGILSRGKAARTEMTGNLTAITSFRNLTHILGMETAHPVRPDPAYRTAAVPSR